MYQICHKFVLRPRTCISIYISPLMEGINYYCFSFSILPSFWAYGKVTLSFSLILNQCHVTRSGHCYFWKKISLSVQSLSGVELFATPWTAACQASLSITNSQSLLKLMSIKSVVSSNHLILCLPLLLLPSIFPSIRVFSKKGTKDNLLNLLVLDPSRALPNLHLEIL